MFTATKNKNSRISDIEEGEVDIDEFSHQRSIIRREHNLIETANPIVSAADTYIDIHTCTCVFGGMVCCVF